MYVCRCVSNIDTVETPTIHLFIPFIHYKRILRTKSTDEAKNVNSFLILPQNEI